MVQVARKPYQGAQYTHQGWLLPDSAHLLLNDELDELYDPSLGGRTRTLLWDVSDLRNPIFKSAYMAKVTSIDHNLYIIGTRAYLSNYCSGLRVLDVSKALSGVLTETAYFDVAPNCATTSFLGSWSSYPYFSSGTIVVNSIERGLFVVKLNGDTTCQ